MLSMSTKFSVDSSSRFPFRAWTQIHTHSPPTNTHPFPGPLDPVQDYPGEPVPERIWILLKQETVSGSDIS